MPFFSFSPFLARIQGINQQVQLDRSPRLQAMRALLFHVFTALVLSSTSMVVVHGRMVLWSIHNLRSKM